MVSGIQTRLKRCLQAGLISVTLFSPGCARDPHGVFVGEYATSQGGEAQFRITHDDAGYHVSARESAGWSKEDSLQKLSQDDYVKLIGQWSNAVLPDWSGLSNQGGMFLILHVPDGSHIGNDQHGHTFPSGFYVASPMFAGDVYKK